MEYLLSSLPLFNSTMGVTDSTQSLLLMKGLVKSLVLP